MPVELICETCRVSFSVQPYRVRQGARFCSHGCRGWDKRAKYIFTPEMDKLILKVYREHTGNGEVKKLSETLRIPRWKVTRHAIQIGAYISLKKEPEWSRGELKILKTYSHRHISYIQKKLKAAGYQRSESGILLKRKRMKFLRNLKGMSARKCAEFFGVDSHWITDKIKTEMLKAERRGTMRSEKQGGDIWFIREKELRRFIIKNPEIIDMRKVEKFYFIELLANGPVHT